MTIEEQISFTKKEKFGILMGLLGAFWRSGFPLSHHPNCDQFEDHVFHIGRLKLCQGCVCQYSGFFSILIFWAISTFIWKIYWTFDFIEALIIALALFTPTFLQTIGLFKQRKLKIIARYLLGVGAFFGFYSIFSLPGVLILFVPTGLVIYCMIYGMVTVWRNYRMADEECAHCTQKLPHCMGFEEFYLQLSQVPHFEEAFPVFSQSLRVAAYKEKKTTANLPMNQKNKEN